VKIAVVAQRYGQAINGGAELHARYIAEHLARHTTVEVLTTCATDYVTWRNELPEGLEQVNGIAVRRFRVRHERDPLAFARQSAQVFEGRHSVADELAWLEAEGPTSPELVKHIARQANAFDYVIFFSYRYYQTFHGVRAASGRAILVPTAERDSAIGLSIFGPAFRGVRALMYNSPEERGMIQAVAHNAHVPSVVVGIGSDVPSNPQPARFRQKYNIRGPFAVYVGRVDENKGCKELFEFFQTYLHDTTGRLSLVLIGNSLLPIPNDPRIRHLGFLDEGDKFDAMAAAELLIMPSYFESLSMVTLEAWALGRPVLANARCDVLKGQSIRSNAGLYYNNRLEFVETLRAIEQNRWLSGSLGKNGRQFFRDHYDWQVIERKYLDMLQRLSKESAASVMEPLPGWFERHKQECPAGSEVVAGLPAGPQLRMEPSTTPHPGPPAPRPTDGSPGQSEQPRQPSRGRRPFERPRQGRYRARGGTAPAGGGDSR
jgi:glycosyltransferase involved in cell wall biosynthesis